jgi:DNA topoisomerase-1
MDAEFGSKHFRTWGGTKTAATLFAETPVPATERERKIVGNRLIDQVAARLGNTRTICRRCYVHPAVIERWLAGTLTDEMTAARRSFRKPVEGLDDEETLVLNWLRARETA